MSVARKLVTITVVPWLIVSVEVLNLTDEDAVLECVARFADRLVEAVNVPELCAI